MRHSRQDAIDTAARRSSSKTSAWHPILAAVEVEPGHWYLVDATNKCYGIIRYLAIRGQSGYRAVTWAERSEDRRLIGYYTSLRAAAVAANSAVRNPRGSPHPPKLLGKPVRVDREESRDG